ncbi:MAG: DUF2793 domain-containing protein [Paracoccaceae bacterium]
MTETTHLGLPHLAAAQAQKHVTHNEALDLLDAIIHLSITSQLDTPPGSPSEGDRHLVIATATGDWAGWEGSIATFIAGAWLRVQPATGWRCWDDAGKVLLVYTGAAWQALASEAPIDGNAYGRKDGVWVEVAPAGIAYDVPFTFGGTPTSSEELGRPTIVRTLVFPADFAGSVGFVGTLPTAAFSIDIYDDATQIGTVDITTGGAVSFSSTGGLEITVAAGSLLRAIAQSTVDATIADISFTLLGAV